MCVVVNKRKEAFDVYIGRGSQWGNPFVIGKDGNREEVIAKFKRYFWEGIKQGKFSKAEILALDGKRLGCFCKPAACHGDVIASAVKWLKNN